MANKRNPVDVLNDEYRDWLLHAPDSIIRHQLGDELEKTLFVVGEK